MSDVDRFATVGLQNVKVGYPAFELGPISLELRQGSTCLVGVNGSGKSTLFRCLAGLQRHSGTVTMGGRSVGYLPQSPTFPRHARVDDLVHFAAWAQGVRNKDRPQLVAQALQAVGLTDRAKQRYGTLSGGAARRAGIATVIVHRPRLLLLDEPTVGLDPLQRVGIRDALLTQANRCTLVVSTHLVEDVRALGSRIVILREGQIVFDGTSAGLAERARDDSPGESPLERGMAEVISRG